MTTHDEKPQAIGGVSLHTWIIILVAMVLVWAALGYLVLR